MRLYRYFNVRKQRHYLSMLSDHKLVSHVSTMIQLNIAALSALLLLILVCAAMSVDSNGILFVLIGAVSVTSICLMTVIISARHSLEKCGSFLPEVQPWY